MRVSPLHPRPVGAKRSARRAFTLIELIVVIVLLTVIAGAIVPRLVTTEARRAETSVKNIAALLSAAAHRDAVGGDSIAIVHDGKAGQMTLETLRRAESTAAAEWKRDRFTQPVEFDQVRVRQALIDGREASGNEWRIEFTPVEQRPTVELIVESGAEGKSRAWYIELLPYDTSAKIVSMGGGSSVPTSTALRSVDLDASGKGDSAW